MKVTIQRLGRALVALALLGLAAPLRAEPFAYIPNSGDDNVSVIDTATNNVVATVIVGDNPLGAAVHPDGSTVYVATNDGVSVIDAATNTLVTTVALGGGAFGTAVHPDGSKVYVTHLSGGDVSVIETATNTVVDTVTVGGVLFWIAVHPDGSKVYAGDNAGDTVAVIDTTTHTVVDTVTVEQFPYGIAIHPDGSKVYVANNGSSSVSVIDTATHTVEDTISISGAPVGVAVNPDGARLYVVWLFATHNVSVIDTVTNTVVDTVSVGNQPRGVAVHPDDSTVYVANMGDATVSVIDTATHTVADTIPVGLSPVAIGQFIGPLNRIGSILTGVNPFFGLCVNLTTIQVGYALPAPDKTLDCKAFGFEADPGDFVYMLMYAADDDSNPPAGPGGTALGITLLTATCTNWATFDNVSFVVWPDSSWDCALQGLTSNPGDLISQEIYGIVE